MQLKKTHCSADDSLLLGPGDAVCAGAVTAVYAVSHFGEYQGASVPHDQVDFTGSDLVVSLQRFEALFVQKRFGDLFPVVAPLSRRGHPPLLCARWNRNCQWNGAAATEFCPGWLALKRFPIS